MGHDEIVVSQEIDLINGIDQDWIDDPSVQEVEFEPEVEQMHEKELSNLRVLDWLRTIQDIDQTSINYISYDNTESNWVAPDGPLQVPASNLDLLKSGRSTGTSMGYFCPGSGGRTHAHRNLITKN